MIGRRDSELLGGYGEKLFLLALALVGFWQAKRFYNTPYDDVFIAYRYAQNLLWGYGFVYNAGENFLGTPAPFFVLLLTLLKKVLGFMDIVEIAGWVSGVSLTLCAFFTYLLARHLDQRLVGAVASLFILFNPLIVMTIGGETPIYLMLASAAFYSYFRERFLLTGLLLALAIMNRGEAVVLVAILFGYDLLIRRKILWGAIGIFLVTLAPWLIFSFLFFGSPLTSSLGAKIAQRQAGLSSFVWFGNHWIRNVVFHNDPLALAFLPLLILGALACLWRGQQWFPLLAWVVAQTTGYLVLDLPFYHWYIAHLGFGVAVLVALGTAFPFWMKPSRAVEGEDQSLLKSLRGLGAVRGLGMVLVGLCFLLSMVSMIHAVGAYEMGQPNPSNRIYVKTGKWLAEHTPPGSSVAYLEIGQIGYYSNRKIIDVLGLVTPGAAEHVGKNDFLWVYLRYQPDYIIYNSMFGGWIDILWDQPWSREAYYPIERIEEPGYPAPLVIYRRNPDIPLPSPSEIRMTQP